MISESEIISKWAAITGRAPKKSGAEHIGLCPVHELDGGEHKPSCSMRFTDGKPLWQCRSAGCDSAAIHKAIVGTGSPASKRIVAVYKYVDSSGTLQYEVVRFAPKDFRQRRPDGNGSWHWNMTGVSRVLYRLNAILAAPGEPVVIVEGEKDADCAARYGILATTGVGGAGKWQPQYNEHLRGREIVIVADKDTPGRAHSRQVARALSGVASSIKVLELPGENVKDFSDWAALQAGKTPEEIRAAFGDLVSAAPLWDSAADDVPEEVPESPDNESTAILPHLSDVADILDDESSELGPVVIDGLLRVGETLNLNAPPKVGKSWLTYGLAISTALGLPWLGQWQCTPGKVLILDNELHGRTLRHRLKIVCRAIGIDQETLRGKLQYECFRGRLARLDELGPYFDALQGQGFSLIILDAYYRFFSGDENSNSETAAAYNLLDRYAAASGAAFCLIHHQSKGNQSEKAVTDTGSGAGSQSRAADSHAVMREHEETGKVVFEAVTRTFKAPEPVTLAYSYPLWHAEPETVPVLKTRRGKKATADDEPSGPNYMTAVSHALPEPKPLPYFSAKMNLGATKARQLLAEAVEVGGLFLWPPKAKTDPARWATIPPTLSG